MIDFLIGFTLGVVCVAGLAVVFHIAGATRPITRLTSWLKWTRLENVAASPPSETMDRSVVEVIDHILELMHTCPRNADCLRRLVKIRDGIFLELPEDRTALLQQVGSAINDCVPSGEPNDRIDDYWYRIRDFMDAMFAEASGKIA